MESGGPGGYQLHIKEMIKKKSKTLGVVALGMHALRVESCLGSLWDFMGPPTSMLGDPPMPALMLTCPGSAPQVSGLCSWCLPQHPLLEAASLLTAAGCHLRSDE